MYSMNPPLTPRRAAVLSFIRDRVAGHGQPPTLAEIAAACGLASRGAARKHVLALAEAGLVEVAPGQARGVRPAGMRGRADLVRVPVLGRVAAGAPIGADAGLADTLTLDARLFSAAPDYLLRVEGDSMIDDGILDGDLVGVHRSADARDGQTVVARLDAAGAVTLGASLLAYVGLKAMGQTGWAKTALVGGLAATGVQFLARPVNDAGAKLGSWLRDGLNGNGNTTPQMQSPQNASNTTPAGNNQGTQFTGAVPTGNMSAVMPSGPTGGTSTAPAQPQQQPPAAVYNIEAPRPPSTLETIVGGIAHIGGALLGNAGLFGPSASTVNIGSQGSPQDRRWLAQV